MGAPIPKGAETVSTEDGPIVLFRDGAAPWQVGDEVWCRFYDLATNGYVAKLYGHVTAVGRDGFTMRRVRPDHRGQLVERVRLGAAGYWPTKAAADEYIAAHPFSVGPTGR